MWLRVNLTRSHTTKQHLRVIKPTFKETTGNQFEPKKTAADLPSQLKQIHWTLPKSQPLKSPQFFSPHLLRPLSQTHGFPLSVIPPYRQPAHLSPSHVSHSQPRVLTSSESPSLGQNPQPLLFSPYLGPAR